VHYKVNEEPMKTQPPTRPPRTRIGARAAPPKSEYIYHWNRIIAALAALVLLIGLIGFGIHAWLSAPSAPPARAGLDAMDAPVAPAEVAREPGQQHVLEAVPAPAEPDVLPPPDAADLPEPVEPEITVAPDTAGLPEPSDPEIAAAPGTAGLPEPSDPEIAAAPDAATPADLPQPADEGAPARPDTRETTEGYAPRVFLPPDTRVNLRAAPSLSSPVLRILDANAELWLLETTDDFYQVRSAEGIVGWISRDFSSLAPYSTPAR
jgi:hypothetical protein